MAETAHPLHAPPMGSPNVMLMLRSWDSTGTFLQERSLGNIPRTFYR